MKLDHINLDQLTISAVNVRKKGGDDVADLIPSIRSIGLIQPLLVRPTMEGYEIVAGQRRFNALKALAEEGMTDPVPCVIMDEGDDAKAVEASLAENFARLPMGEIDQYKAFADLLAKGMEVDAIADHFGVTERLVRQRLAIADIIPPILKAYEEGEIRADMLRVLTLASKKKQREWWKLVKSDDPHVPTYPHGFKQWLFGTQIAVDNALFDLADYSKPIISDLFSEDRYFADANAFWSLQNAALAARRKAYLDDGWTAVHILDKGDHWHSWEHTRVPKADGGHVYVTVAYDGEITFHEGFLTDKEFARLQKANKGEDAPKAAKPELTQAMENYLGLHRHAAIQAELLDRPDIALRLTVAHMIAGSPNWKVESDPCRANSDAIADALSSAKAREIMGEERQTIRQMLDIAPLDDDSGYGRDSGNLVPGRHDYGVSRDLDTIFDALMSMDDAAVMRVMTLAMAESLTAHSPMVDRLATTFNTDMRNWWSPETVFFDLLRNKQAINEMVREVAGEHAADACLTGTAKAQKTIITDALEGRRTCYADNWIPRYLANPASGYLDRDATGQAPIVMVEDEKDAA